LHIKQDDIGVLLCDEGESGIPVADLTRHIKSLARQDVSHDRTETIVVVDNQQAGDHVMSMPEFLRLGLSASA